MNLFRFLQQKRTTELIRCHVPPTLPLPQRITLLKGLVKLQAALISDAAPLHIEIVYNDSFWRFEIADAAAVHFNGENLWVHDHNKNANLAFNIQYISEVFCTTQMSRQRFRA